MNNKAILEGEKVAKQAIFGLIFLGIMKAAAGIVTGMTVIIADALATFTDVLGVFASYIGLKLSRKTADKNFEYGYYKIETFAAFAISVGILILGIVIFQKGLEAFQNPEPGHYRYFAITSTFFAIWHSLRLSKRLEDAGKRVNSLSLLASARDKKMDVLAGIGVLLSIIANYKNIPYVEGIVTIIISLIIFKEGVFSTKESLFFLLDYWDDPKLVKQIKAIFRKEKDLILNVKKLRLRRAGTFIFGEAFVEINPFAGIQDLREELRLLKTQIEELNPYIKDFSIYTNINDNDDPKIAVPIQSGTTLNAKVASTLKQTTAYLFANVKNGKIKDFYIKKLGHDKKSPVALAEFLKKEDVNILVDNNLNSLVYYNLRRTHHILIYPNFSDIKTAKDTIQLLLIDT